MSRSRILPALLALAAFGLAAPATAQVIPGYLGIGYGQHTNKQWDRNVIDDGSFSSIAVEDTGTGARVMGGFQIVGRLGIEFGYTNLGAITASGTSDGSSLWAPGPVSARLDGTGFDIAATGKWALTRKVAALARLGMLFWETDAAIGDSTIRFTGNDDGDDVFFGIGLEVGVSDALALRGEFVRYNLNETDVDSIGLALVWHHRD
jgi:OOP family OmpA-OmpF porin